MLRGTVMCLGLIELARLHVGGKPTLDMWEGISEKLAFSKKSETRKKKYSMLRGWHLRKPRFGREQQCI